MTHQTFDDAAKVKYPYPQRVGALSPKLLSDEGYRLYCIDVDCYRAAFIAGLEKCLPLVEAAAELLHLHSCEQEGLLSGKPTPKMWFDAVNKLSEAISNFPKLTQEKQTP